MGLLCPFGLGLVVVRRRVFLAEERRDLRLALGYGLLREVHRVGTHVCDESLLVEVLRHGHCLRYRHPELAARLLLQCRGSEGRGGITLCRLLLDLGYGVCGADALAEELLGLLLVLETRAQLGLEERLGLVVRTVELCHDTVVWCRLEGYDLALALHDETYGHTLHAACRERRLDLLPQYGRELEAHDAVEYAACLLGVDQIHVYGSRRLDGVQYGGLGDLVEDDTLGLVYGQVENLGQMPRYGLSLAVLIGCQPYGIDTLR